MPFSRPEPLKNPSNLLDTMLWKLIQLLPPSTTARSHWKTGKLLRVTNRFSCCAWGRKTFKSCLTLFKDEHKSPRGTTQETFLHCWFIVDKSAEIIFLFFLLHCQSLWSQISMQFSRSSLATTIERKILDKLWKFYFFVVVVLWESKLREKKVLKLILNL